MNAMKKTIHKRLNITLPESTVALLETVADKGERSTFIDTAIVSYIKQTKQETLRENLKNGAIARSQRDLSLSEEWFDVEEELWQK
jgi:CopG family transcriptional regulator / antitoxin EndoAI